MTIAPARPGLPQGSSPWYGSTVDRPWHRTTLDAPDQYWLAFVDYRDGRRRSLSATAERMSLPYPDVLRQAHYALWQERARAYDRYLDRRACRIALRDRREALERHTELVRGALEATACEVQRLLAEVRDPNAIRRLTPREIVRLGEFALRYERLIRGETTEQTGTDLSALSVDELRRLQALRAKLG